jgi:nucleoside-diphosphate-sugar epimerase
MSETSEDSELRVAPLRAEDLYNMSKLMGESLALHSKRAGVRIARLSNVIGDEGMPAENFLPDIVAQALRGKVSLRSSPASEKDYIDIQDVVELLPAIALHGQRSIYNVASGRNLAHRDWIGALRQTLEFELSADSNLPLTGFPPISIRRLAQEFGAPARSPLDRLPTLVRKLGQSSGPDLRPPTH